MTKGYYRKAYTRSDGTRVRGSYIRSTQSGGWMQSVSNEMKKRGTEGVFTVKARKKGMSVHRYAQKVMSDYRRLKASGRKPSKSQIKLMRQASLALVFEKAARRRS